MVVLEARGLGKDYQGRQVLQCIDLQIFEGEVFCLIGPRGAGKTTLLRLLDLLEKPSSGEVYLNGVNVTFSEHLRLQGRRKMSFVLQKPIVFDGSVRDNIAYGLKLRGETSKIVREKTENILEMMGIADYAERRAKTLSGGEMQLVALARALVTKPQVLFLDEPTANLDPSSSAKVEAMLVRLIESRKMAIVMATHDMAQGQRLANRIGVLMGGRLLQAGSPVEIFCSPASKEIAEFVGVENILNGSVTGKNGGLATISADEVTLEAVTSCDVGDLVWAIIRPEDITLARVKELSSARNVFQGKITRVATVGALVRVEVDCGVTLLGVLTKKSAEDMGIEPGEDVYVSFKASAVHIIKR